MTTGETIYQLGEDVFLDWEDQFRALFPDEFRRWAGRTQVRFPERLLMYPLPFSLRLYC